MDWNDYTDESEIAKLIPESIEYEIRPDFVHTFHPKDEHGNLSQKLGDYPVRIPGRYIATADYLGDLEIFATMNLPIEIDGEPIPPPSLGVWSLLETLGSPFVSDFSECTNLDVYRAVFINKYREQSAPLVFDWFMSDIRDGSHPFDVAVMEAAGELKLGWFRKRRWPVFAFAPTIENFLAIRRWFEISFHGYSMISGGAGGTGFWFGAEVIASNLVAVGQSMSLSVDELLWKTPTVIVGHANAAVARANRVSVGRPKDHDDNRKQAILALARELNGQLHPWQIADPLHRPLTWLQRKHGGKKLMDEFDKIRRGEADAKKLNPVKRNK